MDHAHAPSSHGDASHGSHGAAHHHGGGLSNFAVFMILLVVTVAEVGVAYLPMHSGLKIFTFIAMALYKAVMVAYYFMHLKFESKVMWLVASAPLFLGVLITVGTYPDSEKGTTAFKNGVLRPWSPPADSAPVEAGQPKH